MDDICVGDYVRDYDGFIYKVTEIIPEEGSCDVYYKGEGIFGTYLSMVKTHSKNIIDLIEVDDIILYNSNYLGREVKLEVNSCKKADDYKWEIRRIKR